VSAARRHHPVRGFVGGLLIGLGVALLLFLYGKIAFGTLTPYVIILAGVLLGLVWTYLAPARNRGGGDGNDVAPPPPPVASPIVQPEPDLEPPPEPQAAPQPAAEPEPDPPAAVSDAGVGWTPTHLVPATGVVTYAGSEEGGAANGRLDPGLEVQVVEQQGDWAKVLCSNGWSAWVDARQLVPR
jgi:hypothetical protein